MKVGDIVVARTGASVGKTYKYSEKDGTVYFAGFLIRFTANNDYDSDFVFYNTLTKGYDKHIKLVSQRSGQPGVNVSELQSFAFNAPSLPKQRALATFFTSLDNQISAAEKRLASLKQVKAASLQAMFPQEGETTPKLRFKGCEVEWKKVKLGEVCSKKSSILSENSLGNDCGKYAVYGANGFIQNIPTYDMNVPYVGIIKDGSGVGRCSLYPAYSSLLGTLQYILANKDNNIAFIQYLLETFDFSQYVNGSGIPHIYFKDYSEQEVFVPSLPEQRQIASYFTSLDHQISAQSSKISKLKQIKSACLDQMFV